MRLILVRHGETTCNEGGRYQGQEITEMRWPSDGGPPTLERWA